MLERKHEIEGKSPPCRVSDLVRTTPSIVSKHERRSGGVPIRYCRFVFRHGGGVGVTPALSFCYRGGGGGDVSAGVAVFCFRAREGKRVVLREGHDVMMSMLSKFNYH